MTIIIDNVTASTKLGYDLNEHFDLGFAGRVSDSLGNITGDAFDPVTFAVISLAHPDPQLYPEL